MSLFFVQFLLDDEIDNEHYALKERIGPLQPTTVSRVGKEWKDKIHRRRSDLPVVDNCEHPVLMEEPVDFLHRTIQISLGTSVFFSLRLC